MSNQTEQEIARSFKGDFVRGIRREMKRKKVSQSELARRMRTSRAVVHRLMKGSGDTSITLTTISRAAAAVGCTVRVRVPAVAA